MTELKSNTPKIFTSVGFAPEVGGYALAKFSRSAAPYEQWISDLTQEKSKHFYNTFYFQYGHASIADLVHINLVIEDVPLPFAVEVFTEQLIDGQESSTRYQDYSKRPIYVPIELRQAAEVDVKLGIYSSFATNYLRYAHKLIRTYEELKNPMSEFLSQKHSPTRPADLDDAAAARTANARTFDRTRYLLPYAVNTGLGVIMSARTAEQMLIRLLSHPVESVREFGEQIHEAIVERPAYNPLAVKLREQMSSLPDFEGKEEFIKNALEIALENVKSAPTLIKYAKASQYIESTTEAISQATKQYLNQVIPESGRGVMLHTNINPEIDMAATVLFSGSQHSFRQTREVVYGLSPGEINDLNDLLFAARGAHDRPLVETVAGYNLIFDVETDNGGFRDLNRHRNTIKIPQNLRSTHGFDTPADITEAGLSPTYEQAMLGAGKAADIIEENFPGVGQFLLPLGYRRKMLWKMDSRQLQYIVENRTTTENHFSNREIAYRMYHEYAKLHPSLAKHIRAVSPAVEDFWKR